MNLVPDLPRPESVMAHLLPDGVPVLRELVRDQLVKVFGSPPVDRSRGHGDPGLFGPGSASWKVLGDPASIVGGVRGLMFQTLHPGSMAGVHDHSAFSSDPIGRLQRTTHWVITSAFGSVDEVLASAARVRSMHPAVRGVTPGGETYAADDPHLLAWVQCALTSSFLATDAAYAAFPVGAAERDAFVREQSFAAALLDQRVDLEALDRDGLRRGEVELPMLVEGSLPRSVRELEDILAAFDWELEVNHQARQALAYLANPPLAPLLRAAYAVVHLGASATFTDLERRRLGLAMPVPKVVAQAATRLHLATLRTAVGRSRAVLDAEARARAA